MHEQSPSRRQFLTAIGNLGSAGWIALNWPQIVAAAEPGKKAAHSHHGGGHAMAPEEPAAPAKLTT
ncbi:hypothetical protein NL449_28720, partial [Klebsiella pneumoniae]|nr:hypothetical protein [Klebsiella pneumoniae]